MSLFTQVVEKSDSFVVTVAGNEYQVIGACVYFLVSDRSERYVKLVLPDHKVLAFGPEDQEVIFGQAVGQLTKEYPPADMIEYGGQQYRKQFRDYQRVEKLLFGDPDIVEGEVDFTDYECADDPKLVLSIGPVSHGLRRDDIAGTMVDVGSIQIRR